MSEPMWLQLVRAEAPAEHRAILDVPVPDGDLDQLRSRWLLRILGRLPRTPERDAVMALLARHVAGGEVSAREWLDAAWAAEAASWAADAASLAAAGAEFAAAAARSGGSAWSEWAARTAYWAHRAGVSWPEILSDLRAELAGEVTP